MVVTEISPLSQDANFRHQSPSSIDDPPPTAESCRPKIQGADYYQSSSCSDAPSSNARFHELMNKDVDYHHSPSIIDDDSSGIDVSLSIAINKLGSNEFSLSHQSSLKETTKRSPFLGLVYTFFCSFCITLTSVTVKKMTYISSGQLSLVRNTGVFVGSIPLAVLAGQNLLGPKEYRLQLLLREIVGSTAIYLNLLAYRLLPLSEAAIILSTTPAAVMVLARMYLKEPCGIVKSFAVILAIVGALLSVRITELMQGRKFLFTVEYVAGIASAVGCVLCLTIFFVSLKKLKDVHYTVVLLYMGLVGMAVNAGLNAVFGSYELPRCGWDPYLVISVGVFGWLGHIFLILAVQVESVGIVSVARSSLDIVIALLFQIAFFGLLPDAYNLSGALAVIAAMGIIGLRTWMMQLDEDAKARKRLRFLLW